MDTLLERSSPTTRLVPLGALRTDGGTQLRSGMHADTVADYTAAMQSGARFPPLIVYDDGQALWVADGHHRLAAAQAAGLTEFPVEVRPGALRDAVLCAANCNAAHGLRRTSADKRHTVEQLLLDAEWRGWSNRELARVAAVSLDLVNRVRAELEASERIVRMETRTASRNGKTYTVQTGKPTSQSANSASATGLVPDVAALLDEIGLPAEAAERARLATLPEAEQIDAALALACAEEAGVPAAHDSPEVPSLSTDALPARVEAEDRVPAAPVAPVEPAPPTEAVAPDDRLARIERALALPRSETEAGGTSRNAPGQWWRLGAGSRLYIGHGNTLPFIQAAPGAHLAVCDIRGEPVPAGRDWSRDWLGGKARAVAVALPAAATFALARRTQQTLRGVSACLARSGEGDMWFPLAVLAAKPLETELPPVIHLACHRATGDEAPEETGLPAELLVALIERLTPADGVVLDPEAGSGAGLLAAAATGRRWWGAVADPEAGAALLARWEHLTGEQAELTVRRY